MSRISRPKNRADYLHKDDPRDLHGNSLPDFHEDHPRAILERKEEKRLLLSRLKTGLSETEYQILIMRDFVTGKSPTFKKIGAELGLTPEKTRELYYRGKLLAKRRLRKFYPELYKEDR